MRNRSLSCLAVSFMVIVLFASGCAQRTYLFNNKDLTGWKPYLGDENVDQNTVWSVKDGVIHCKGRPNGYIRTSQAYANYKLHVEWRWAEEPTNSGVLLHTTGQDKVWPRPIEAQLQAGNAGTFILIGTGLGVTVDGKRYQDNSRPFIGIDRKHDSSEKPAGEWNSYDIFCIEDKISLYVNGMLQNKATKATQTSGWICLQSEGSPIEFRNIYIEPVK